MPDPIVTFDVLRQIATACNGKTCNIRLVDGSTLNGTAVLDQANMVLTVTVASVPWLVPVASIVAVAVS